MKNFSKQYEHRPDGDNAQLPFELWRAPIFQISNQETLKTAKEKNFVRTISNDYGDIYTIYSSDLLRPTPDMNVLLGLIALFQYEIYDKEEFDEEKRVYELKLPFTTLYRQLGFTSKHKDRLIASLMRLSSLKVKIIRKKTVAGKVAVMMSSPFGFDIVKRKPGEKSDRIHLQMHRLLFPRNNYLFRSSVLCSMLESDTAKLIFWLMSSRSHLKVTTKELYDMLFPRELNDKPMEVTPKAIWKWEKTRLTPAIAELKKIGWYIKYNEATEEWTFKVPMQVNQAELEDGNIVHNSQNKVQCYRPQPGDFAPPTRGISVD